MFKMKNKRAFTIIELIVVMTIIGILVLLAMPKFMGYTEKAMTTEILSNTKQLENASERYYMDKQDWPRLSDDSYTSIQVEEFAQQIKDKTGKVVTLDPDGEYYDIDYSKLSQYIQKPKDGIDYILQNPVGEIYYLEGITETAKTRLDVVPFADWIKITTVADLSKIGIDSEYPMDGKYMLMNNIDLNVSPYNTGVGWISLGSTTNYFVGKFNGNNYTISNLRINNTNSTQGFFGAIKNAEVYDLNFTNVNITANSSFGALAGASYTSIINNVDVQGVFSGTTYIGGLIGCISGGQISNSNTNVSINGVRSLGGIIGYGGTYFVLDKSKSQGSIIATQSTGLSASDEGLGGIAGYVSQGTIKNSSSAVNIQGLTTTTRRIGGIVGSLWADSLIENTYSSGTLTGPSSIGGIVGFGYTTYQGYPTIQNSYSVGKITGTSATE